jgi:hypothetical protein
MHSIHEVSFAPLALHAPARGNETKVAPERRPASVNPLRSALFKVRPATLFLLASAAIVAALEWTRARHRSRHIAASKRRAS